ncbi:MAG: hypothetical protein EOO38_02245 [Cytophagaceae bacterium]|nr:MAG: hypothetical protein EOO38_02245 [Cytophagaceae bacterium]
MKKPMLDQRNSPFFKLPAEIRQRIYAANPIALSKLERTCQLAYAEAEGDVLVDAKNMQTNLSPWSQARKSEYGDNLPPLKIPKTARALCRNAFVLNASSKEILDVAKAIKNSQGDNDARHLLSLKLQEKMQINQSLLQSATLGLDLKK